MVSLVLALVIMVVVLLALPEKQMVSIHQKVRRGFQSLVGKIKD